MLGQFPPLVVATDLRDSTRDVVFESKDEVACGACGRRLRRPRCCGKRAFCNASVDTERIARVFHSTGRIHGPLEPDGRERRRCRGRERARCSVRCRCGSRAHVVSFRPRAGASCVRRIERPFMSMRWASWSKRSQMAAA